MLGRRVCEIDEPVEGSRVVDVPFPLSRLDICHDGLDLIELLIEESHSLLPRCSPLRCAASSDLA